MQILIDSDQTSQGNNNIETYILKAKKFAEPLFQ